MKTHPLKLRASTLCAVVIGLLSIGLTLSSAWAQEEQALTLGVYTPRAAFSDSLARTRYAGRLAEVASRALGRPVKGRGFATGSEFLAQVKAGAVDLAVIDAQVHVEHPGWPALAQATHEGRRARSLKLVARKKVPHVGALEGRPLARVAVGRKDAWFVTHFIFQGQLGKGFFGGGRGARDVSGAMSLVKLGKADAAFSYTSGGLPVIFESRPAPLPVLVKTGDGLTEAEARKAAGALKSNGIKAPAWSGFAGYEAGAIKPLKVALNGALDRRVTQEPVMADVESALPSVPAYPGPVPEAPVTLPALADGFVAPEPPADAF